MEKLNPKGRLLNKWWLRLSLAMVISLIVSEYGSSLSLARRLHSPDFYPEYGATLVITWLVMEIVHHLQYWLEARYAWHNDGLKRGFLQALLTFLLPAFIVYLLASLYFFCYGMSIHKTDYLYYAYPFILLLILALNFGYITLPHFLEAMKGAEQTEVEPTIEPEPENQIQNQEEAKQFVMVLKGAATLRLPSKDIASIYILEKTTMACTFDKVEYVTGAKLDDLENDLDPNVFFRINRQLIANIDACKGYTDGGYGKLEVNIEPTTRVSATVSQLKARAFRQWLQP